MSQLDTSAPRRRCTRPSRPEIRSRTRAGSSGSPAPASSPAARSTGSSASSRSRWRSAPAARRPTSRARWRARQAAGREAPARPDGHRPLRLRVLAPPARRRRPRAGGDRRRLGALQGPRQRDRVRGAVRHLRVDPARLGGGGSSSPDKATGGVLGWPGGQVIVAIAGLVLIGVGLYQGYEGVKKKFLEKSKTEQMSEKTEKAFTTLGIAGHLARMVVFVLIGYFLRRRRSTSTPTRRSASTARSPPWPRRPTGRSCWASWRRARSRSGPTRSPTPATAGSSERAPGPRERPVAYGCSAMQVAEALALAAGGWRP